MLFKSWILYFHKWDSANCLFRVFCVKAWGKFTAFKNQFASLQTNPLSVETIRMPA